MAAEGNQAMNVIENKEVPVGIEVQEYATAPVTFLDKSFHKVL